MLYTTFYIYILYYIFYILYRSQNTLNLVCYALSLKRFYNWSWIKLNWNLLKKLKEAFKWLKEQVMSVLKC